MTSKTVNAVFLKDYCITPRDHLSGPVPKPILIHAGTEVIAEIENYDWHNRSKVTLAIRFPCGNGCYQFGRLATQLLAPDYKNTEHVRFL